MMTSSDRTPRGQKNITGKLLHVKDTTRESEIAQPQIESTASVKKSAPTQFRTFYDRGDLPLAVDNCTSGIRLKWRAEIESLDFHHFLPLMFDGLRETKEPYASIARQGVQDMLGHGAHRILPVVPQLIIPIKLALDSHNPPVMCVALKAIQQLVLSAPRVGEALVPYYRQILPSMNAYKGRNKNTGDRIDYSQKKAENLGDLIEDTLQLLERQGGEDAFINIKYMIPTYESCLLN